MADRDGNSSSPWIAFLAGIILVAVVALGIAAYTGNLSPRQETAQLELETPDINVNPPDVNLPPPPDINLPAPQPAPAAPPSANSTDSGAVTPPQ